MAEHTFTVRAAWTGNTGTGTSGYRNYRRDVELRVDGKDVLAGSAAAAFRGDAARWNPEDKLIAALSECHLLSYLHAAVLRGVIVTAYSDEAVGTLSQEGNGGHFTEVVLRPVVTVQTDAMTEAAQAAHEEAHEWCFIANSVNFPVRIEPTVRVLAD